ncbi:tyrosine-type recombinase/integrase [Staphylococcus hyicus]|uniref:tyrosine-type recombinase/integrase n=1 Tax=Staphylococcus hyicus TaxID=1284 RepID=UPI00142F4F40|nr:tyrosine-type recombinase/integrase [Staphylococcus hyicus]NJI01205.1 tyrosine-type recombinase/integrase [Staphylococcus hyicus]NJI30671.1 tyrosine-type recombinase/integrase [Staphylococcus hyicus]
MKIVNVNSNSGKNFMIIDSNFNPVDDVTYYLKYLESVDKSENTLKTYAYCLKRYFMYLELKNKSHKDVTFDDLVDFVMWLKSPNKYGKVIFKDRPLYGKSAKTINLTITVVTNFYDYLFRTKKSKIDVARSILIERGRQTSYKSFLDHVNKKDLLYTNTLKIKVPKEKMKILSTVEIKELIKASNNIRDKFMIQLLYETGLRIGELLSLYIDDIKYDLTNGHQIILKNRKNKNGARLKSGERKIYISQSLIDLYDDYLYEVLDEVSTDSEFLFIKIKGKNVGEPLDYNDVNSIFKRLRKKTGITVHPHLLRHTHATIFYNKSKNIKQVQERLGHSNIQTTMDLYIHNNDQIIRENWEKVKDSFQIFE